MELSAMHWLRIVSQLAANALVSGVWEGVVLAAAVGLCLSLTPKTSATTRFTIWTATFLVLAFLPFIHITPSAVHDAAISDSKPLLQLDTRWSIAIAVLWAVASLLRGSRLAVHGFKLRSLWRNARPVNAGSACDALLSGNGRRGAELCVSTDLDLPSVIGFFSPRILIPVWLFEKLTQKDLEQIVLHEVEHLRRGDDWINLFQKLSLVLFPLNPGLMWIEKRLCFERELACDDGVIRATRAPRTYATCLTSLAERSLNLNLGRRAAALTLGAWERRSALARRVHSILRGRQVLSPPQARGVTGALVLGLLLGAAGLSRCPQLVSFSGSATPVETLAQALPAAMFHNAVFNASRAPHPDLLKASMDSRPAVRPARSTRLDVSPRAATASLGRSASIHKQNQRWLVVTSWEDSTSPQLTLTVMRIRPVLSPYAAVPTDGGWIFFQL